MKGKKDTEGITRISGFWSVTSDGVSAAQWN